MKKKTHIYILDSNVLFAAPNAILGFKDNIVVITSTTLQEMDKHKKDPDIGYLVRAAARIIDEIETRCEKVNGQDYQYRLPSGGILQIETDCIKKENLPQAYDMVKGDNQIISVAVEYTRREKCSNTNRDVHLVTNDILMRTCARACGVDVQEYMNIMTSDEEYTGYKEIDTSESIIGSLYKNKKLSKTDTEKVFGKSVFFENEFVILTSNDSVQTSSAIGIVKNGEINVINSDNLDKPYKISPKNVYQKFALYALQAPASEIPMVILKGPAGCGKTLLAIASSLDAVLGNEYKSVMYARRNIQADNDLGALPGTEMDKIRGLLNPLYDNLDFILRNDNGKEETKEEIDGEIDDIIESGAIEPTSISFIRGRNLQERVLIIDEAQNMSTTQIETVASRIGAGSKIIICGDIEQIDDSKLNRKNNGISVISEVMKGSKCCAQVTFDSSCCERSELAKDVIEKFSNWSFGVMKNR